MKRPWMAALDPQAARPSRASVASRKCDQGRSQKLRRIWIERHRTFRRRRIEQLLHAQLRLLERALAAPIKRDAALERFQRVIEAELALLHARDELLELVERFLEIGNLGRVGSRHGAHANAARFRDQSSRR